MDPLEGADVGLACLCGSESFERVVVQRKPSPPIVTDFVACVGCRAMYFAPQPDPNPALAGAQMRGIGSPAPDTDAVLKRDAAIAARDYEKPGRRPKLRGLRRPSE